MNGSEWHIKAPAHACSACGRDFADQEVFTSRLTTDPESGYARTDSCENCRADRTESIGVWKTTFRAPALPARGAIRRETAESLLRQLIREDNAARRGEIFVLAVLLERRRLLIERDVQDAPESGKLRIYEHRGTGETFLIPDPELRLGDLESVRQKVISLLTPAESAP